MWIEILLGAEPVYQERVTLRMEGVLDPDTREREIRSFYHLDDGYRKIVITMDPDPFYDLGNGYRKLNLIDFLLNEKALESV